MSVCPLCNGLYEVNLTCPACGAGMRDAGFLEGFLGPYSPYLDESILDQTDGVAADECCHLFACPVCGLDRRITIHRIP